MKINLYIINHIMSCQNVLFQENVAPTTYFPLNYLIEYGKQLWGEFEYHMEEDIIEYIEIFQEYLPNHIRLFKDHWQLHRLSSTNQHTWLFMVKIKENVSHESVTRFNSSIRTHRFHMYGRNGLIYEHTDFPTNPNVLNIAT